MRTLFCTVVLTFTVLATPAATAWEAPISKASLVSWQELVAAVAGWFGDGEMGPLVDPEGIGPGIDPEGLAAWLDSGSSSETTSRGRGDGPSGEMGPGMDPEG